MSAHTPGPWRVIGSDTVVGPKGNVVAECCGYSDHAKDPTQQAQGGRESNASLIAAAPDLVAALELMVRADEAIERGEGLPSDRAMLRIAALDAAAEALAKARGEA